MEVNTIAEGFEYVPIDSVKRHPSNPRRGNVEAIKESIKANGFFTALTVQKSTGFILAGNHRWQAAKELGMATVPAVFVDIDEVQAEKILLADNRLSDIAENDDALLAEMLGQLSEFDSLLGTGYDDAFLEDLVSHLSVPDFQPVSEDLQGRLDEKKKAVCPSCGHEFTPS